MMTSLLPLCAGHVKAQFLNRGLLGIQLANDLTLIHHKDAVGQIHNLIQFQRNQKHRLTGIPLRHQTGMDAFNGAHIQTTGGLNGNDQGIFSSQLTADDGLCWLPPDMLRATVMLP